MGRRGTIPVLVTSPEYPTDIVSRESSMGNFGGADRPLYILSLLGDRTVTMDGQLLTTGVGRLPIRITTSFWRHFHCAEACKAVCCISTRAHMVFLPDETGFLGLPEEARGRFSTVTIDVNGSTFDVCQSSKSTMGTKPDLDRPVGRYCQFLGVREDTGGWGCTLHQYGKSSKPVICQGGLEWTIGEVNNDHVRMNQRLLGRHWLYDPPMMCEYTDTGVPDVDEKISIFGRYREWATHFGIVSALDRIEACIATFESVKLSGKSPKETIIIQ